MRNFSLAPARISVRGFTLLEVMIALAIFVAAAMALDSAMGASTRGTIRFEEKTLASWLASNKLVEMQLYQRWPEPGREDEETEFAGRKWLVQSDVAPGPFSDTRRVDVSVGPVPEMGGERFFAATLTALLVKPAEGGAASAAGSEGGGGPSSSGGLPTPGEGSPPSEVPASPPPARPDEGETEGHPPAAGKAPGTDPHSDDGDA